MLRCKFQILKFCVTSNTKLSVVYSLYGFTCLQTYSFYQQQHGRCWFRTLVVHASPLNSGLTNQGPFDVGRFCAYGECFVVPQVSRESESVCPRALDTFHLVAISGALYFYLVSNYSNPIAILEPDLWCVRFCHIIAHSP